MGPDERVHRRGVTADVPARVGHPLIWPIRPMKCGEGSSGVGRAGETPAFPLLGEDAAKAFDAVEEAQRAEVDRWRELSVSTGYTE